jgi:predicted P-loop ATPase
VSAGQLTPEKLEEIREEQQRVNAWAIEQGAKEWRESPAGKRFLQPVELKPRTPVAWSEMLRRHGKTLLTDEENVRLCLEHDPALAEIVAYDKFAEELLVLKPMPGPVLEALNGYPRPWTDADTTHLQTYLQRTVLPRVARDRIETVLLAHASSHATKHPLRDYLNTLTWDGRRRLRHILSDYFGAYHRGQPESYICEVGFRWIVSGVARVMEPGCQADYAIVLEGPQGEGKTTALRILASERYFSDSLPHDLASKDARDHLRGKWIVELPELAQFRRSEIETVKSFLSRREERYRPAYGRHEVTFRRQCVFAGSTNEREFLVDTTGNRRFWPVACGSIDLDALAADRDQLLAEAVHAYRAGERWHPDRDLERLAATETRKRMATDPWHTIVERLVTEPPLSTHNELTPGAVLLAMDLRAAERTPQAAKRVAAGLAEAGWRMGRRTNKGQTYIRPGV